MNILKRDLKTIFPNKLNAEKLLIKNLVFSDTNEY